METHALGQRVLAKAALRVGGASALAACLKVSESQLAAWLAGTAVPPAEVIMRAVGLVLDEPGATS